MKNLALTTLLTLTFNLKAQAIEEIFGVMVDREGITFQVTSNGCTRKKDFEVTVSEVFPHGITLRRNNPDFCEAFLPYGKEITFSYKELSLAKGAEFTIENPLRAYKVF